MACGAQRGHVHAIGTCGASGQKREERHRRQLQARPSTGEPAVHPDPPPTIAAASVEGQESET